MEEKGGKGGVVNKKEKSGKSEKTRVKEGK